MLYFEKKYESSYSKVFISIIPLLSDKYEETISPEISYI